MRCWIEESKFLTLSLLGFKSKLRSQTGSNGLGFQEVCIHIFRDSLGTKSNSIRVNSSQISASRVDASGSTTRMRDAGYFLFYVSVLGVKSDLHSGPWLT